MTTLCWIHGYSGRMGSEIRDLMNSEPSTWSLLGGTALGAMADAQSGEQWSDWNRLPSFLKKVDLIIDFSAAEANKLLLQTLNSSEIRDKAILLGTTGLDGGTLEAWFAFAKKTNCRLLQAPNTSLGVLLTLKVSQLLGQVLSPLGFDIELVESHHRNKIDAPSGTGKFLAEGVARVLEKHTVYGRQGKRTADEIGMASLRGGSVFGEHELRFLGEHEELTVSHRALSRTLFAEGALHLSRWLLKQKPGAYQLEQISIEEMVALLKNP